MRMKLFCYISLKLQANPLAGGGGKWRVGDILLHISYVRMCFPKRCRFGLNTGIDFAHFGVESRMVECMKIFVLSIPDE